MREKKNYPLGAVRAESLVGKNVVNMYDGVRICTIRDVEFTFESQTGEIELLLLPQGGSSWLKKERKYLRIPWDDIKKIGKEVIIVDLGERTNNKQ